MCHNIKSRYIQDLTMLFTCNVQEKAERVFALVATKIAFKRFLSTSTLRPPASHCPFAVNIFVDVFIIILRPLPSRSGSHGAARLVHLGAKSEGSLSREEYGPA